VATTFLLFVGGLLGALAVVGMVALGILYFASSGMDGFFSLADPSADLTCWNCGGTTRAGRRHCQHCGKELQ
jgi:hypothetical protein